MTQACQLRRGLDVKTMEFVCGLQLRDSHFPVLSLLFLTSWNQSPTMFLGFLPFLLSNPIFYSIYSNMHAFSKLHALQFVRLFGDFKVTSHPQFRHLGSLTLSMFFI